ncbi:MAG: hypothetical protein LLF96_12190 [Eubacteriales bacterium]|nr:hypothetical protein [Eubacteriales bacterium]
MQTANFGVYPAGTLFTMLRDAYAADEELVRSYSKDWQAFDDFVYDLVAVMEHCGFVSLLAGVPPRVRLLGSPAATRGDSSGS